MPGFPDRTRMSDILYRRVTINWNTLHQAPFSLEIFGHIVLSAGEYLFDSDFDSQVRSYGFEVTKPSASIGIPKTGEGLTFVHITKAPGSELLPVAFDILEFMYRHNRRV